jgi:hypothetical protein
MTNEKSDDNTGGKTKREAADLNGGVHFLSGHISPGNLEVILEHIDGINVMGRGSFSDRKRLHKLKYIPDEQQVRLPFSKRCTAPGIEFEHITKHCICQVIIAEPAKKLYGPFRR